MWPPLRPAGIFFHSPGCRNHTAKAESKCFSSATWMLLHQDAHRVQTQDGGTALSVMAIYSAAWCCGMDPAALTGQTLSIDNMEPERWLWYCLRFLRCLSPSHCLSGLCFPLSSGKGEDFQRCDATWTKLLYSSNAAASFARSDLMICTTQVDFPSRPAFYTDQESRYEAVSAISSCWVGVASNGGGRSRCISMGEKTACKSRAGKESIRWLPTGVQLARFRFGPKCYHVYG